MVQNGANKNYTDELKGQAAVGFEPLTFGSVDRRSENTSPEKTKACETAETQLTPQLTPNPPKQPQIDTENLPADLAEIVAVWPELPEHIKRTIQVLARSV
ncbi:MAG: hypothetical protein WC476_07630 [Phycisphaerae bacterium]